MHGGLQRGAAGLRAEDAQGLGLLLVDVEDGDDGERDDDQDDGEGAEGPAEVDALVEELGDGGAGEGGGEVGGGVEGEDQHAVLEGGDVGDEDVDDEAERDLADPREDLRRRVRLDVVRRRLHHHPHHDQEQRPDEPLHPPPDVDDLADAERHHAADHARRDVDHREEPVLRERGRHVGRQGGVDGG